VANFFSDDDSEDNYLSYYFDAEANKILPRFDLSLVKLESLDEWLREENDERKSPLYTLDKLNF
jgi:hypothetical protein